MTRHFKLAWRYLKAFLAWLEAHHKALVFYTAGAAFITACSGIALVAHHVDLALIAITDAANQSKTGIVQTLGKVNDTLDALNKPCKDIHGDIICGPIPQLSQTEKNIGILAAQGAEQTKQSAVIIKATTQAVNDASAEIKASLAPLPRAITAATGALDKAQTTIAAFQPVPGHIDGAVDSFNKLLQSPDLTGMLKHGNEITGNAALITGDFYHFEKPILNPVPCKTKRCKFSRFMKSELPWWIDLGAKSEQLSQWWKAIPVRLTK